jgi:hypothetical protein
MADGLDIDAMLQRFKLRAEAVRSRQVPPVEGEARKAFIDQSRLDFQDFAILSDATGTIEDGVLVLRVDLRPKD